MPNYADGHIVTSAEFNAMLPVGSMVPFAVATAPSGWLLCDGSAVSRTTYSDLFALIGTTYGAGNGTTTFNVPDLRGRIPVGKNSATFATLGATGGEETHTLTSTEMPSHTHTGPSHTHTGTTDAGGSHSHVVSGDATAGSGPTGTGITGFGSLAHDQSQTIGGTDTAAAHTHTFTTGAAGTGNTGSAGSGGSHNNLQPYIVLPWIIRY